MLKVFGWQDFWYDPRILEGNRNGGQVRCICAAKSKAEIKRTYGLRESDLWNCCVTGNAREIEIATGKPLTIFASSYSGYQNPFYVMREPPTEES